MVVATYGLPQGPEVGRRFFFGGKVRRLPETTTATQVVHLHRYASLIDSGDAEATLEARLGGLGLQRDDATVFAAFGRSAADVRQGRALGVLDVGPVKPRDRLDLLLFVDEVDAGFIPRDTRVALITVRERAFQGRENDGYADLVSLHVSAP